MLQSIIGAILSYMDKPWKVMAIISLVIIGGVGLGLWHERERVFFAPNETSVALRHSSYANVLNHLLADTDADIVAIWSVDANANAAIFEMGRDHNGPWPFTPPRVPLIVPSTNATNIVRLFAGQTICNDLTLESALRLSLQALAAKGAKRVCITPVPPDPRYLLALLVMAWRQPPSPQAENAAIASATHAAANLVEWN